MRRVVWLVWGALLLAAGGAGAQSADEFELGAVVFADGDTAHGRMAISLADDLLQLVENQGLKTYTARQVALVRLGEPPRLYTTHPAALRGNLEVPAFFEVLAPGPYASLLARDKLMPNGAPVYDPYALPGQTIYGPRVKRDYFWLDRRGHVRAVPVLRRDLARILEQSRDPAPEVEQYVKTNKISAGHEEDLIALTQFYNQLKSTLWQQEQQRRQNPPPPPNPQGP